MPMGNVLPLERMEGKIEAVRGTAEAVMTHKLVMLANGSSWQIDQEHEEEPEMTATFMPFMDTQLKERRVTVNVEFMATFEMLIWWLQLFGKGGTLSGVTTGSTPPGYTYQINPSAAVDDIKTATLKIGDGSTVYKLSRAAVNTFTARCNPQAGGEATWRCTAELKAVFVGTTTFDSPADETLTKVVSYGTKVYMDAIGGTIGTTQLLNRVRMISITWTLNIEEKSYIESGVDAAADFGRGWYTVDFEITTEHTSDDIYADVRNNLQKKIRIEKTGAQIGTTPTTNYLLQIDFPAAKMRMPSFSRAGVNKVAVFGGKGERPAGGVVVNHKVVIAAATLAA